MSKEESIAQIRSYVLHDLVEHLHSIEQGRALLMAADADELEKLKDDEVGYLEGMNILNRERKDLRENILFVVSTDSLNTIVRTHFRALGHEVPADQVSTLLLNVMDYTYR